VAREAGLGFGVKPQRNEEGRGCEAAPRSGTESLPRLSVSGTRLRLGVGVAHLAAVLSAAANTFAAETGDAPATEPARPMASATTPQTSASGDNGTEVTVTGRRPLSRDRTEDATLVGGDRLRDAARPTLLSALAAESAGLYVNSTGALHGVANGASGGIFLRGLGGSPNSQVLVVEDGIPDYQGIFGHPIPDAYVPALIDEAMIEKGGDSVLYGSNAMGGVIALQSRFRTEEGYELASDTAYGSFDTTRETVTLLGHKNQWDWAGSVHAMSTSGHRSGTAGRLLVGNGAVRHRLSDELSLTLRNKAIHIEGADPGPASHPYANHFYDVWRDNGSFRLEWSHKALRLNITPAFNTGVHRLYDGFRSVDVVAGTRGEVEYRLGRTAEFLVGVDQHHIAGSVENRATLEVIPVNAMNDVSTYGQVTLRPLAPMSVVLGARELYSDRYGSATLYKAGFRSRLYRGLFAHTRLARNFRQPTLRELYLPFPTANPDLRPEYALNWDAGLSYLSEHLEGSATLYRTEARDMIRYFGVWPAAEVVNIDHIVFWGFETMLRLKRLGPLSVTGSLDHKNVGRFTRQNPSTKANFGVELRHSVGADEVVAGLSGEWVTGLYMANYHRQPMANVFVIDGQLRYRHVDDARKLTLEPYLLLRNLFDERYAYIADYPMPGFNAMVGLRITV
jgi:outer membrane receptor protein involved in Fe transport